MLNLLGIDPKTLETQCVAWGQKRFHAHSILRWVHQRGVDDFRKMTDLSRAFRDTLQTSACLASPPPVREVRSQDGTVKWLLGVDENQAIETVFIPEIDRGTLCVSSQVGCLVNCPFCSTGQRGFSRNLAAHEIIGQVWHAKKSLGAYRLFESLGSSSGKNVPTNRVIDNVVFMGMGEPLQNYSALLASLRILLDDFAYGLSRRRVTVSTSGIVPMIDRLREDCPVALAISLHAPFDALRNQLVPINKKYPLNELIAACQRYLEKAPRKSITFEYVMLQEVNDKDIHLDALLSFARTMPCKFNLIPFNAVKGSGFQCSLPERIQLFANTLSTAGIVTTVRRTRGDDIDAACGQLAGSVINRIKNRRSATEQEVPFSRISSF